MMNPFASYDDPNNLLQQLGLMGQMPATQAGAGEVGGTDATQDALTQMNLGAQGRAFSPQYMMQMARIRAMYNQPHLLGGARTQGMPGGAYPGGNLLQPGYYPGQQPLQAPQG